MTPCQIWLSVVCLVLGACAAQFPDKDADILEFGRVLIGGSVIIISGFFMALSYTKPAAVAAAATTKRVRAQKTARSPSTPQRKQPRKKPTPNVKPVAKKEEVAASAARQFGYIVLSGKTRSGKGLAKSEAHARAKISKLLTSRIDLVDGPEIMRMIGQNLTANADEFFADCDELLLAGDWIEGDDEFSVVDRLGNSRTINALFTLIET